MNLDLVASVKAILIAVPFPPECVMSTVSDKTEALGPQ